MKKTFCDVCHKEVKPQSRVYRLGKYDAVILVSSNQLVDRIFGIFQNALLGRRTLEPELCRACQKDIIFKGKIL